MKLIAKKDFNLNGIIYAVGDEVFVNSQEDLIKLNEKGFIEPLTAKQIQNFDREQRRTPRLYEEEE